jgi:ribonuclease HII
VVAAAVILPPGFSWPGVDDSKKLEPEEREALAEELRRRAVASAVAVVSVREIDETDIRLASLTAMKRALTALDPSPDVILTDAFPVPGFRCPQVPLVHGDALSISIAAASIIAKVHRDRLMDDLARQYPAYAFDRHKGYAVAEHREILARIGPCPEHRLSFHGVVPGGAIVSVSSGRSSMAAPSPGRVTDGAQARRCPGGGRGSPLEGKVRRRAPGYLRLLQENPNDILQS